jgi:hypothetical protein
MTPGELEADARFQQPFVDYLSEQGSHTTLGYIMRTPQAGGHWIAVLSPAMAGLSRTEALAGLLCDSLRPHPFLVSLPEMEELLIHCALSNTEDDENGFNVQWACFLITGRAIAQ